MNIQGWGVGVGLGRGGLGVGNMGLGGSSEVFLESSGTNRDNLMGDGFIAVLEKSNGQNIDTLRVVVPSENSTRLFMAAWLEQISSTLKSVRQCQSSFQGNVPDILRFKDEASYVADRLRSILRMAPESRPLITIYGQSLSDHAIIGAAIRFGTEDRTLPLFPISLLKSVSQVVDQTIVELKNEGRKYKEYHEV